MSEETQSGPVAGGPLWRDGVWRAVTAAFLFNGLLFGVWASRVPAFKERFDLEPGALGLLLLALAAGAIVSFPLAGALSEKWGADRLTLRCGWVYGPVLVGLALAPGPVSLGAALFLFGAVHGSMDVAMNGWGAQCEDRLKRSTMSVFHAMFSLGAGIGAASGYVAVRSGLEPQVHFIIVAFAGGLTAVAIMIPAVQERVAATPDNTSGPLLALPTGPLVLIGLIAFTASMGEGAIADWSAVFLRTAVGSGKAQAALGYATFSVTMVLVRLSGGRLVERFGPVVTTRASAASAFAGLTTVVLGQTPIVVLGGFALVGAGYAVLMPLAFSRAARDAHVAPGPAIAAVATLGYGGLLLGPPVIGFVAQMTGLRLSFVLLALLALLAFALAPALRTSGPRD
ncbi:MFS transporter [uncultured Roseobacter sp.]|uniref:MFS transporter n=1 Tax=uncultured Roseobacter sp. TaxID=114847 RepID=UPI0026375879|nr:MFS transporter [uncultured Roseobacter sp.]